MTYDYYEEKRKQEEARIYRDRQGFIIRRHKEFSAYVSGQMEGDSSRRFKLNNSGLVEIIEAQQREQARRESTIPKILRGDDEIKASQDKFKLFKGD